MSATGEEKRRKNNVCDTRDDPAYMLLLLSFSQNNKQTYDSNFHGVNHFLIYLYKKESNTRSMETVSNAPNDHINEIHIVQ